ncbi:sensor histidine kinase [Marilutibacter spongiae]|uniref:histidine kinase n=1 Tax=Marilutibacter spongiae TaxID=2025720 RepID=A0A7W3Y641_9GAMM|nr:HAMP domain-containing sensor histidine kinase [Lysobacter spongiae]MBB1060704.1 HAMP domain-containing histidine kinase [Lysobacter spongiae]
MRGKRRLHDVLARQWIVFALVLLAGFAAMTVLTAYMLEDRLIDDRLRDVGRQQGLHSPGPLPPGFMLVARRQADDALRERTAGQPLGAIREFRLPDGRYLHVLAMRDGRGAESLLVHDATAHLAVNPALVRAWPWLLLIATALALVAWALAHRFVARVSGQARELVARFSEAEGPHDLHALADAQGIFEFSELARLNAKVWESRRAVLDRERETLAFLAHELRTPLQSARTSLALLDALPERVEHAAWQRLHRAVGRLARASHALLWLGDGQAAPPRPCKPLRLLGTLVEELAPLATAKGQTLRMPSGPDIDWPMPGEVAETILNNLLLNAIQHGDRGEIRIEVHGTTLGIDNPLPDRPAPSGFGVGRQLAERLVERFGGTLRQRALPGHRLRVEVDVGPGGTVPAQPERNAAGDGLASSRPGGVRN